MRLYTKQEYANRSMHLPFVGEIQLDKNASFECDEEDAQQVIAATKGSLEFHGNQASANLKPNRKDVINKQAFDAVLKNVGPVQILEWLTPHLPKDEGQDVLFQKPSDNTGAGAMKSQEEVEQKGKPAAKAAKKKKETEAPKPIEEKQLEPVVNADDIKEAINLCDSVDELKTLVDLIPGANVEEMNDKGLDDLKSFLIQKIDEQVAKQ